MKLVTKFLCDPNIPTDFQATIDALQELKPSKIGTRMRVRLKKMVEPVVVVGNEVEELSVVG